MLLLFSAVACKTKESYFYDDAETPGVAIFSNKNNNVMSCFIDGRPWQTISRTQGGWGPSDFEVYIRKRYLDSLTDVLSISWEGSSASGGGEVSLYLTVAKNFGYRDFNKLQGQRMSIDGVKNYFTLSGGRGAGFIYFNTVSLDSNVYGIQGKMSGLLNADFNRSKLSSGRFDHSLSGAEVQLY